jgi:hypothetical protein
MTDRHIKETEGAWVIHHGRKISLDLSAPAEFSALDETAKAAELLIRLGENEETTLTRQQVEAVARAAGLNPRSELPHYLQLLKARRLIDESATELHVLGVTSRATLVHASEMFADAQPTTAEKASIDLAELTSSTPQNIGRAVEYISDIHKTRTTETKDFIDRSIQVGFVDFEGVEGDGLLFNGNLFRRDTVAKSAKVASSLSSQASTDGGA